jgi:hypothetical protein
MPTLTRTQLRNGVSPSTDLTAGTYSFSLENNTGNTYFVIKGINSFPFTSASISSTTNISSVVSGSINAGFAINAHSTASFDFVVTKTIPQDKIKFTATNPLVYDINDITASGSVFGIEAIYS